MAKDATSAAERAYREIRRRVLEHVYEPGTMLGETALAGDLGMSRTPVRTALARLQDEGWISVYPKRGAQVRGVSPRAAAELADARVVLEATSVDRADAEARLELADRLDGSIEAQRAAFAAGDVAAFIDLTLSFHRSFVEVGDNRVLLELYDRLVDRHRFLLFGSGQRLLLRCEEIIAEHRELVDEVRHGDGVGFAKALRKHVAENSAAEVGGLDDVVTGLG